MLDLQQLVDHCRHCQKGHAVVEFLEEFLPKLEGTTTDEIKTMIRGAVVTITVEIDRSLDDDRVFEVARICCGETESGGLISGRALEDLDVTAQDCDEARDRAQRDG